MSGNVFDPESFLDEIDWLKSRPLAERLSRLHELRLDVRDFLDIEIGKVLYNERVKGSSTEEAVRESGLPLTYLRRCEVKYRQLMGLPTRLERPPLDHGIVVQFTRTR